MMQLKIRRNNFSKYEKFDCFHLAVDSKIARSVGSVSKRGGRVEDNAARAKKEGNAEHIRMARG